ncbi:MAG: TRAP transporter large permease subunit [Verrucomicrobia bacterium]|nr:TRAP transporter large permease subunit [Verrucomicrobiota bacterium]MBI3868751.1 TRAP transporter large permease subunit [Verrucomicrobiota bacterium]
MSAEIPTFDIRSFSGSKRWRLEAENSIVVLALAAMMLLPLLEILLRKFAARGIPNVSALVQHLTLLVGVVGGALAARDQRLLALSPLSDSLKGRWRRAAAVLSQGWSAAVCVWLVVASLRFIDGERRLSQELALGIPKWWVQCALPIGFASIAARLVWHSGAAFLEKGLTLAVAALLLAVGQWGGLDAEKWWPAALGVLALATVLGAPVFVTLSGAALILFWGHGENVAIVANKHYSLSTNSTLPSIPLFTLAGYFLAEGGASKRIIRVFQAFFGSLRGGPAIVTALVCAFFTSFTGASGVTILALGGLLMPVLVSARYPERAALGLLTSAGSLGLLFPPCLPLILYVIVANTSAQASLTLREMFWAGIGPGILLVALTAWWGIRSGGETKAPAHRFDAREAWASLVGAQWELLVPVVALVSMFSGWATPVEASAVTALYALITQTVLHRDLHIVRDLPRVMTECGLLIGGVLLILGVALGLTHWLVDANIPTVLGDWVTAKITSPYIFLLAVNGFLLIVGCLMDIFSAIVVVVPLLAPIASKFGINPLHFGIIFLANMELGFLTPPVGMNLFLSSYRFKKPMSEVIRAVLPMLLVLTVGVLLITYCPPLTLWLPTWMGK